MNPHLIAAQCFVLSLLLAVKFYVVHARPQLVPGGSNIEVAFEGRPSQGRVYIIRGDSIRLRCTSSSPSIAWRFVPSYIASAGKSIDEVTKAMQGQMIESVPERNYYANRLSIDNTTERDTGTYFCYARDTNQFSRIPVNIIDWSDVVEGELLRGPKLSPDGRLYAELLCRQKLPDPLPVHWVEGDARRSIDVAALGNQGEMSTGEFGEKLTIDKDVGQADFEADYTCQVDTSRIAPNIRISVTFGIRHSAKDHSIDIFITKTSGQAAHDGEQLPAPSSVDHHHPDNGDYNDAVHKVQPSGALGPEIVEVPSPPTMADGEDDQHQHSLLLPAGSRDPDDDGEDQQRIVDGVADDGDNSTDSQHHNLVRFPVVRRTNCTQSENGTTVCEEVPVDADETVEYLQPNMGQHMKPEDVAAHRDDPVHHAGSSPTDGATMMAASLSLMTLVFAALVATPSFLMQF